MVKGDTVIQQDDIGDSFFILEEGMVEISRKNNVRDPYEEDKILARLGKNGKYSASQGSIVHQIYVVKGQSTVCILGGGRHSLVCFSETPFDFLFIISPSVITIVCLSHVSKLFSSFR